MKTDRDATISRDIAVKNAEYRQVLYTAKHCQAEADNERFDGKTTI